MRKFAGFMAVFVLGFAACAFVLQRTGALVLPGGGDRAASTRSRADLLRTLDRSPQPVSAGAAAAATTSDSATATAKAGSSAVAEAAARVEPAVVNIDITGTRRPTADPFGMMRGENGGGMFRGAGSGIILSADGYVVTNNHVIEPVAERGTGDITITLENGRKFEKVEIVGRDPQSDLAVLKIQDAKDLTPATLGDSETIRVGDWAIAIGNPLGFRSTVTLGIISALNRRDFRVENDALDRVIQTDAAINPGNSGGALADINGQVIGINTAIASSTGASVGIGFAIPINAANRIIKQLIEKGRVTRPYLGVMYSPVSVINRDEIKERYPNIQFPSDNQGALIINPGTDGMAVVPNSPADKAGIKPFDVIREIDGRKVDDVDVVKDQVQKHDVGDKITLRLWRNGQNVDATVTLEAMPENYGRASAPGRGGPDPRQPMPRPRLPFGMPDLFGR